MRKFILPLILAYLTNLAFASNSQILIEASQAYSFNNLKKLSELYTTNYNNPIISYLYAKSSLAIKNNPNIADKFIVQQRNNYMKNDLLHQLLIFYYNNNSYAKYIDSYDKLINTQISTIETCGFDLANLKLSHTLKTTTNIHWLIRDNITTWCADLGLMAYRKNLISQNALNQILSNLVINSNISAFNKLAPIIGIKTINFTKYKNIAFNKLPKNQFIMIYNIASNAKKNPDNAEHLLNQSKLTKLNKILLGNYIAMQYAKSQQFNHAIKLYEKFNSQNINNDEFEWKARSYLANGKWSKLITTIKDMPNTLQNKNNWLYWLAKSYDEKGQYTKATVLLKKIPKDYSYYYLIAQGELEQPLVFNAILPKSVTLGNGRFANDVENALYLYQLGISSNSKILTTIGRYEWFMLTRTASQKNLIAMSIVAHNQGAYELSISSASHLNTLILYLSFPTPYLSYYQTYCKELGIESTYSLAVSRQESRFNSTIIAFDGGEGLMQIMPETTKYISKKSKYSMCSTLNAQCNIKYGTWYLANLYHKFGNYIYASAGYNGGPNRAKRWQENLTNLDNRIQMELIPISVTRDYVQKVLVNKAIYDTKLNGSNTLNMLNYVLTLKQEKHNTNNLNDDNTDAGKI